MRQASLIVWDEASMSSRYAMEAVDRALQDVMGNRQTFGDKVVLLTFGRYCQSFRVVPTPPAGSAAVHTAEHAVGQIQDIEMAGKYARADSPDCTRCRKVE